MWLVCVLTAVVAAAPNVVSGQPTQCKAFQWASSCTTTHPYICEGEEEQAGTCVTANSRSRSCCCVNEQRDHSSVCTSTEVNNLCCNGQCLDPAVWECCAAKSCYKQTHECREGECVQKNDQTVETVTITIAACVLCSCCCCVYCASKAANNVLLRRWMARLVVTLLVLGGLLVMIGFATWDGSGSFQGRPIIVAGVIFLPFGLCGTCVMALLKDEDGNSVLVSTFTDRLIVVVVDKQSGEIAVLAGENRRTALAAATRQGDVTVVSGDNRQTAQATISTPRVGAVPPVAVGQGNV